MINQVAIIGIGCRFPGGANSPTNLWKILCEGKDCFIDVPKNRWDIRKYFDSDKDKPAKTHITQGGFLQENIEEFDANFFGISPREAASLDPQQRIILESTWEAIEDSGLTLPFLSSQRTGVFFGGFHLESYLTQLNSNNLHTIGQHTAVNVMMTMLSNKISYLLNLSGPSLSVDTACSSSLTALELAVSNLNENKCDIAFCGGANMMLNPNGMVFLSKSRVLSERSRAFGINATGYGRGEGAGILILRPLSAALKNRDHIYSIIKNIGLNQDGKTVGITLPNKDAQIKLMEKIYHESKINLRDIKYFEAHGTGTSAGDQAEAGSINRIFSKFRKRNEPLPVGSIKTNIGHTEAAAGVAGVIKASLVLKNRKIPPSIHSTTLNPDIPFNEMAIKIPQKIIPINTNKNQVIYAGVNSFGYGGSNAHALLKSPPIIQKIENISGSSLPLFLVPFSARHPEALKIIAKKYSKHLSHKKVLLNDFCFSAIYKRTHHNFRGIVISNSKKDLINQLENFSNGIHTEKILVGNTNSKTPKILFVYPGVGPQWFAMGRELWKTHPIYRKSIIECDKHFKKFSKFSIVKELLKGKNNSKINQTQILQPAIVAVQISLTNLWKSWNIIPDNVIGHSLGEISAAYAAGTIDIKTAMKIASSRGNSLKKISGKGKMLAVGLSPNEATNLIVNYKNKITIAAINDLNSCTLSGDRTSLKILADMLSKKSVFHKFLEVDVPYHSPITKDIIPEFKKNLGKIVSKIPKIGLFSSLLGSKITTQKQGVTFWVNNIQQPVLFKKALESIPNEDVDIVIEIGPHPVLKNSISSHYKEFHKDVLLLPSLVREHHETLEIYKSLSNLFLRGININWDKVSPTDGNFIKLPTYPWQKEKFWNESEKSIQERIGRPENHPAFQERLDHPDPSWVTELNSQYFPYLNDHQVNGEIIFPGAGYIDIATELIKELFENSFLTLSNLNFKKLMSFDAHNPIKILTRFNSLNNNFYIFSKRSNINENWNLNFQGKFILGYKQPILKDNELSSAIKRCDDKIEPELIYERLSRLGLKYGHFFKAIKSIHLGQNEGIVKLKFPKKKKSYNFFKQVSLLDGLFQSIISILPDDSLRNKLYLPRKIKKIIQYRILEEKILGHILIKSISDKFIISDIKIFNSSGNIIQHLLGVTLQRIPNLQPQEKNEVQFYFPNLKKILPTQKPNKLYHWDILFLGNKGYPIPTHNILKNKEIHPIKSTSDINKFYNLNSVDPLNLVLNFSAKKTDLYDHNTVNNTCLNIIGHLNNISGGNRPINLLVFIHIEKFSIKSEAYSPLILAITAFLKVVNFERLNVRPILAVNCLSEIKIGLIKTLLNQLNKRGFQSLIISNQGFYEFVLNEIPTKSKIKYISTDISNIQLSSQALSKQEFRFETIPTSLPADNEVTVKTFATAINFKDLLKISNNLENYKIEETFSGKSLGMEASGIIEKVGKKVTSFSPGERVVVSTAKNCLKPWLNIKPDFVFKLNKNLTLQNSVHYVPFVTAYFSLIEKAGLISGEKLLIHNATGSLGLACIQVAQWVGAEIYCTVSTVEKIHYLQKMGISKIYDSTNLNFCQEIKSNSELSGVDVIIGAVQNETLFQSTELLTSGGRYLDVGKKNILENSMLPMSIFDKNISYIGIDIDRLTNEKPEIWEKISRKIFKGFEEGIFAPLPTNIFPANKLQDSFDFMAKRVHIGRIIIDWINQKIPVDLNLSKDIINPTATYIITGGLGGFGLEVTKWLVENGARYVVPVSRSGPKSQVAKEAIQWMEEQGAQVKALSVDVSNEKQVLTMMESIAEDFPEVRGVIHSAMVLDDKLISEMDKKSLEKVFAPKVGGVINLHKATLDQPIDFFVCFSSITSVIGNIGQANYAAANGFLDGFAPYRRSLGLPCTTINWGAIGETGVLTRNKEAEKLLKASGINPIPIKEALQALETALLHDMTNIGVFDIDWEQWAAMNPKAASSPFFSEVIKEGGKGADTPAGKFQSDLEEIDKNGGNKMDYSLGRLKKELTTVLKMKEDSIDTKQSLNNLGVDSLMGVEFASNVQKNVGVEVSSFDIMKGISLDQLAEKVLGQMDSKYSKSK